MCCPRWSVLVLWPGRYTGRKTSVRTLLDFMPPTASEHYGHVADLSKGRGGSRVQSQRSGQSLGEALLRSPRLSLGGGGSSFTYTFIRSPERPQRWLALQKHGNLSIFQVAPAAGMLGNGLFQKFHHVVEQERGRGRPSDEAQRWTPFFLACL